MQNVITLLFCVILSLITYHDFKYRELPLYILVIAFFLGILTSISQNGLNLTLYFAYVNIILISFQLGLTILFFSALEKKFVNIFKSHLGIGDVIFFLVVIFCFSPVNFIIFIILSGLATLLLYIPCKTMVLIPLAGSLSMFLCVILLFKVAFGIVQPYNDLFLMDIFFTY
jgi:hypothetical protein